MTDEMPARVQELEIRVAFQEDLITTLNRDVADLSTQVQRLQQELRRLRDGLESVRIAVTHDSGDEPPPPHY